MKKLKFKLVFEIIILFSIMILFIRFLFIKVKGTPFELVISLIMFFIAVPVVYIFFSKVYPYEKKENKDISLSKNNILRFLNKWIIIVSTAVLILIISFVLKRFYYSKDVWNIFYLVATLTPIVLVHFMMNKGGGKHINTNPYEIKDLKQTNLKNMRIYALLWILLGLIFFMLPSADIKRIIFLLIIIFIFGLSLFAASFIKINS